MSHWIKTLAKEQPWQTAYPIVAQAARDALVTIPSDKAIGTAALVALLWPGMGPRDVTGKAAMTRMYQALKAMAEHDLADCVKRGEPEPSRWGKPIRRMFWHQAIVKSEDAKHRKEMIAKIKVDNPELWEEYYGPNRTKKPGQ